jgi:hypothetical protein
MRALELGLDIGGRGPMRHGRTPRPSALSSQCSASAPTPAPTNPRQRDGKFSEAGSGTTASAVGTPLWALARSPGWPPGRVQRHDSPHLVADEHSEQSGESDSLESGSRPDDRLPSALEGARIRRDRMASGSSAQPPINRSANAEVDRKPGCEREQSDGCGPTC